MPIQNPSEAELRVLLDRLTEGLPPGWRLEPNGGVYQRRYVRIFRDPDRPRTSAHLVVGQCPVTPYPDRGLFFMGIAKNGRQFVLRTAFPPEHKQHVATVEQLADSAKRDILPTFDAALAAALAAAKQSPRAWRCYPSSTDL